MARWNRCRFVLGSLVVCMQLWLAPVAPADETRGDGASRPNIVLILADDLGWGDVGFNGRSEWNTPHLDKLAAEGTVFKRWYTAGVVCAPSRAALLTGKYGIHNGVCRNFEDLPREQVTIAEALHAAGYATALFGKWHHGAPRAGETSYVHPLDQGFDEFCGFTNAAHAWEQYPKELWFGREKKPVDVHANTSRCGSTTFSPGSTCPWSATMTSAVPAGSSSSIQATSWSALRSSER